MTAVRESLDSGLNVGASNLEDVQALLQARDSEGALARAWELYRTAIAAHDATAAERSLQIIVELDAGDSKAREALADLQRLSGRYVEAVENYRIALEANSSLLGSYQNLSGCLIGLGRFEEAVEVLQRGVRRFKRLPDLYYNLGLAFDRLGRLQEAVEAYYRAVEMNPRYVKALTNLGNALREQRRFDEADARLRSALREAPESWSAHLNLGNVLKEQGLLEEAQASYERAAELAPQEPIVWSNLLALRPFRAQPGSGSDRDYGLRFDATVAPATARKSARSARGRNRRIRIGYVSADLRNHVGSYFVEPVLERHDRNEFEIFCYDNNPSDDEVAQRLRATDTTWRTISGASDRAAADCIVSDRIDILVDLMTHTVGHRLGVFARKPAPVQIKWRGFPGSSGLQAMDYWITDRYIAARQCPQDYQTERLLPLPHCERCFRPPPDCPPVSALPLHRNGAITFGSFNAVYKLTDSVLELWSDLLLEIPHSRLMLVIPEGKATARVLRHFRARGVSDDRLQLIGRVSPQDFLALHSKVDLSLDSFPFNGVTTTLQSLWMGVPVLTLEGVRYCARVGGSILMNLGLHMLIAHSNADFIAKAQTLASNPALLAQLRQGMRSRMQASPLLDEQRFTRDLEALYRESVAHLPVHRIAAPALSYLKVF